MPLKFPVIVSHCNLLTGFNMKSFIITPIVTAVLLSLITVVGVNAQNSWTNDIVVIGNEVGESDFSVNQARDIFLGRVPYFENKTKCLLVLPSPKNESAEAVAGSIYQKSIKGVQKLWLSLVFQGRGEPPLFVDNEADAIAFVKQNEGAVAALLRTKNIPQNLIIPVQ